MPYAPWLPLSPTTSSCGLPSIAIHAAPEVSGTGVVWANGSGSQRGPAAGAAAALPDPAGPGGGLGGPCPRSHAAARIARATHVRRLTSAL